VTSFYTRELKAVFSPSARSWTVETTEFTIQIRDLILETTKQESFQDFQTIKAEKVTFTIQGQVLTIVQAEVKEKVKRESDLYDPDRPRNLAKSVTVR
jgi:glucosamine 6-phosphate synthetase-like amidotransferase/phosphosugar isomerase protein